MDPLEKLRQALAEYLALGEDTPVAAEAQALMAALDGGAEGAPPPGGEGLAGLGAEPPMPGEVIPPEGGELPPEGGLEEELPPEGGPPEEEMPPPQDAKTFEGARAGAKDRLKKLNRRGVKA